MAMLPMPIVILRGEHRLNRLPFQKRLPTTWLMVKFKR